MVSPWIPIIGIILELIKIAQPEQTTPAKILEKGKHEGPGRNVVISYVTFVLADCTRHKMEVNPKIYETLIKNSSGTLYYKELRGKKRFIGFDSVGIQSSAQPFSPDYRSSISINIGPVNKSARWVFRVSLFLLMLVILLAIFAVIFAISGIPTFLSFFVAFLLTFIAYCALKKKIKSDELHNQRMKATVVGKKHWRNDLYIIFSLEDGKTKKCSVLHNEYAVLTRGDTGMLTFRDEKDSVVFVSFEGIKDIQNEKA